MVSNISIIFLVNSSSNKSRRVIENFHNEWVFEDTNLGFVTDGTTGIAANYIQQLEYPYLACKDPTDPVSPIMEITNRIGGCDYLISIGWSYKVPIDVLDIPSEAALNVHSSYLPNYRGLSVHRVQWAHAEDSGGVTVHRMTDEIDRGEIIVQQRYNIGLFDSPLGMVRTIGELSGALTREAILLLEAGYVGRKQEKEGEYYEIIPWSKVLAYGTVNRILRGINSDRRLEVPCRRS